MNYNFQFVFIYQFHCFSFACEVYSHLFKDVKKHMTPQTDSDLKQINIKQGFGISSWLGKGRLGVLVYLAGSG